MVVVSLAVISLVVWLAALSAFDLRSRRLPNMLTLPGAAAILLVSTVHGSGVQAGLGAAALAGIYLVGFLLGGMGGGDVKLALGVGAATGALGADAWLLAALTAPVLTLLFAGVLRTRVLAHGPSMCLATALSFAMCGL